MWSNLMIISCIFLDVNKSYDYFMYFFWIEYKGSINNEMWLFGKLQLTWIVMKKMWESFWREREMPFFSRSLLWESCLSVNSWLMSGVHNFTYSWMDQLIDRIGNYQLSYWVGWKMIEIFTSSLSVPVAWFWLETKMQKSSPILTHWTARWWSV